MSEATLSENVAAILAAADADIAARRPVCRSSGRCCHFETYGHRLYVTAAELHHFAAVMGINQTPAPEVQDTLKGALQTDTLKGALRADTPTGALRTTVSLPQFFAQPSPQGCPYQINNLCTARDARPLGCRVYFCDENAQSWQNDLYEKYHAQLQALHTPHTLPYRYLEWRAALKELKE